MAPTARCCWIAPDGASLSSAGIFGREAAERPGIPGAYSSPELLIRHDSNTMAASRLQSTGVRPRLCCFQISLRLRENSPSGPASLPDCFLFWIASRWGTLGLPPHTLLGALPQTPPGTSPWTLPRFARFEAAWPYSGRISKEKAISPSPLMWYGGCTSAPQELMPPTPRTAPQTHSTVRRSGGSSSWCVAFSSSSAV